MLNSNVVITFDGLLVFCFSPNTRREYPDIRSQCKIGILHETETDVHELSIKVYKEQQDGSSVLADPPEVGMTQNPLTFDQSTLRGLSSFHLYLGDDGEEPPKMGCVIREPSFDTVLNLNGLDFYQGHVDISWDNFTPFYATVGSFAGVNETGDAEFCRVSEDVLQDIKNTLQRPNNWYTLLDSERRMLTSFARKMKTEIEIGQSKFLIAQAKSGSGVETIFRLPHPAELEVEGYVLEINNLDSTDEISSPDFIVNNCANFTHICNAVKVPNVAPHPVYGLTYNFDFSYLNDDELTEDIERCEEACCISCEADE